ncbi:hypothetical protein [Streptosporangium sp. G12]
MTDGPRPGLCGACRWPISRLWSLYLGYYWGADVREDYLFLPAAACIANRGPLGYGPHTPPAQ